MRGSIVGAWSVVVVVLSAGCSSQSDSSTQQPAAEAKKEEAPKQAEADGLCALDKGAAWDACDGQRVRLEGRAPQMVMQHPTGGGGPPGAEQVHESYVDVEGGSQIVVLSRSPNACQGAMVVTGTLRSVDLGGEPGTKDSYKGWRVADATIECR